MVLKIRLQHNHSFVHGAVTCPPYFINPIISPEMQAELPIPGRETPETRPSARTLSEQFSQPLALPRAGSTNPTVRAEGRHIKPGNNPATEASRPRASLRSFLLPGRSLFLGVGGEGGGGCD